MILRSLEELENTRKKLQMLEEQYETSRREPDRDEHVRDLELQSLKGLINQLKEEIARFECRATDTDSPHKT